MELCVGQKIRHYKGGEYEVVGFAHHTETDERLVLYKPFYPCPDLEPQYPDGVVFARPVSMFTEEVECNGLKQVRFQVLS